MFTEYSQCTSKLCIGNMGSKFNPRKLIVDFAGDNPSVDILQFIRDDPEGFSIADFSAHGKMNTILQAKSVDREQSVVIKYGETTARMDPKEKVSLERQVVEYDALELLWSILPGGAPQPYCLDRTHNIIAMGDLSTWELLGIQLQDGRVDTEAASSLGRLLANMHISTSRKHVSPERWEQLFTKFNHADMREEDCHFHYVRTYVETHPTNKIPESALPVFREFVKDIYDMEIPQKLQDKYRNLECFIHADCHWKSVFVKEGQAALLDFEYSFLGAAAENVAHPITAYLFCYNNEDSTQKPTPDKLKFQADSVQAVRNMLNAYMEVHPDLQNEESQAAFLPDVAVFLGSALVLLGIYYAMDEFNFHTDVNRIFLFTRGFLVMKSHEKMNTVDKFVKVLFQT